MRGQILAFLSLVAFSAVGQAGVVTGRCVTPSGVGVPGVNITVNHGGNIANGGTDANGFFTATVTPNGNYDFTFIPPPPPASTSMALDVPNVNVGATTVNLGNVVLPAGVSLSGRVLNPSNQPVAGVNLDVVLNGNDVTLTHDLTDVTGNFSFTAPAGAIELRFKTEGLVGPVLAPKNMFLTLSGNTNVGNVKLNAGFFVSMIIKRASNGAAVVGADIDVVDPLSKQLMYTPGDNTDSAGFADVVLPAGTYDVEICPPAANLLVAQTLTNKVVTGTTFLGTTLLANGVVLSGNVQAFNGVKYPQVDVDASFSSSGAKVTLCDDNTDGLGNYSVVSPTGTFNLKYTPPYSLPLGSAFVNNVVINANKVQNAVLPSCPFFTTLGTGKAGTGGITPQIAAINGSPRLGNKEYSLSITQGRGGAKVWVLAWITVPGGSSYSGPLRIFGHPVNPPHLSGASGAAGAGAITFSYPVPKDPGMAGMVFHARAFIVDPLAVGGISMTKELQATYCQ